MRHLLMLILSLKSLNNKFAYSSECSLVAQFNGPMVLRSGYHISKSLIIYRKKLQVQY